jgi:hypothetical protein
MLSWLDRVTTDRVAAMREFLLGWYPGPASQASPAADVPASLAELYAVAAGRPAVLGTQNAIYPPDRLYTDPDEGLLVFAAENQGNFTWQIDPTEDDPAVWLVSPGEAPVAEREPLSGFLVQFCLFEAIAGAPCQAYAWSTAATVELDEVPLAPWHWPGDPTRFFAGQDLVLCTSADNDLLAGARTPEALRRLARSDVVWDVFED